MQHVRPSRLALPILCSSLLLVGCSKAEPTTQQLVTEADKVCTSMPADAQSECVAWFLSGYEDAKAGAQGETPSTEAQRTGYAAGIAHAS